MKAHIMCSLDSSLAEAAREKKINISNVLNTALSKELEVNQENDPEIKEKKLLERQENALKEAENQRKIAENCQKELENIENEKEKYAEMQKTEAKNRLERRNYLISSERKNWRLFRSRGELSTSTKREKVYKQRAKQIGFSYEDYITEIVEVCERGEDKE
jgi:hypothetical protein